jgi:hypothetical protein
LLSGESIDEVLDDVAAPTTSVDPRDTWKGATQ